MRCMSGRRLRSTLFPGPVLVRPYERIVRSVSTREPRRVPSACSATSRVFLLLNLSRCLGTIVPKMAGHCGRGRTAVAVSQGVGEKGNGGEEAQAFWFPPAEVCLRDQKADRTTSAQLRHPVTAERCGVGPPAE